MRFILNQQETGSSGYRNSGRIGLVAVLLLTGIAIAFGTTPDTVTYNGQRQWITDSLELTPPVTIDDGDHTSISNVRELKIQPGNTVAELLSRLGIADKNVLGSLLANQDARQLFTQLAPGKIVSSRIGANDELQTLIFPLNGEGGKFLRLQGAGNGGVEAQYQEGNYETRIMYQSAVIRHSLFGATDNAGIPDSVAVQVADIFGGVIDFHRDLRKNDRLSVIYELKTLDGRPEKLVRILAAEFINDGRAHHAFWFRAASGTEGHYDLHGNSLKKAFLRSPLEFSRVTSGFSSARYHPVLREVRAHRGIDYGAPIGTRVKATGDGVVDFAGIQGGYGKVIAIRHAGGRTTVYGHLSGFAPGIKKGGRVQQGDAIGYVGATGLATGPHLHYEFRVNGIHQNPQAVVLPPSAPLPANQLAEFRSEAVERMGAIKLIGSAPSVMLD